MRFELMKGIAFNYFQDSHLKPLGQLSLIPPRFELEYHFYQKCVLPIKLKNLFFLIRNRRFEHLTFCV